MMEQGKKEIDKSKCLCCMIDFKKTRDYDNHIKTDKHIKKALEVDENKCPFCDYITDDRSNMNKHLKTIHNHHMKEIKEKVVKKAKEVALPLKVIKVYLTLLEQERLQAVALSGLKCRWNRLKSRFYKEDEKEMIETKLKFNQTKADYNNTKLKKEDILKEYPELIKHDVPPKNLDSSGDDEDNEEAKEEELIKQEKEAIYKKYILKEEQIKQLEILKQEYIDSKGDKFIARKMVELEKLISI